MKRSISLNCLPTRLVICVYSLANAFYHSNEAKNSGHRYTGMKPLVTIKHSINSSDNGNYLTSATTKIERELVKIHGKMRLSDYLHAALLRAC